MRLVGRYVGAQVNFYDRELRPNEVRRMFNSLVREAVDYGAPETCEVMLIEDGKLVRHYRTDAPLPRAAAPGQEE